MRSLFWSSLLLLAACGGPEANVKSQDPYERFLGERELVGRTDAAAMTQLVGFLEDPHYLVVTGAIEILAGQGRPEFIQHFVPKLKHKHPLVRQAACEAIATIHGEEGIPGLVETAKDPEPGVRRSALRSLSQFPSRPESLRTLVDAVADKEPSVSYLAHRLLCERTGRKDVKQTKEAWAEAVK
ncbi:MAG: HEAT repeat domain-containing protein [Planctomycetes bacterium]|nr:HEAT repeat domain-containing protein [Planctomycetota bacterium]